jgi:hypothetical protein
VWLFLAQLQRAVFGVLVLNATNASIWRLLVHIIQHHREHLPTGFCAVGDYNDISYPPTADGLILSLLLRFIPTVMLKAEGVTPTGFVAESHSDGLVTVGRYISDLSSVISER